MQPAVLIRLRPLGPWRSGPGEGGRDQADPCFGSDRLFSAVTLAMQQLGTLGDWLEATVRRVDGPAVAFTSLFPFGSDGLFAPPPATLWPPPPGQVTTPSPVFLSKLRWKAARFVPVTLVETILLGQNVLADQWLPDAQTGCLLRRDRPSLSPFRFASRTAGAVDRATQSAVQIHTSACVEFESGAGLWTMARFANAGAEEQWGERVRSAFRLLADTGFGGKRSSGWGQTQAPEFQAGSWPGVLMPKLARRLQSNSGEATDTHWLLSLYSPSPADAVDWSGGDYSLAVRGGFVHGTGESKKLVRLVTEGSVLAATQELAGAAVDVAPESAAHPVYRSGFALALRLPVIELAQSRKDREPVETPSEPEALEQPPCAPEPEPERDPEAESETAMPTTGEPEQGLGPEPESVQETESAPKAEPEPETKPDEPASATNPSDEPEHRDEI
jgi:CRISPR type III-A-associated RAMP protein Csm4